MNPTDMILGLLIARNAGVAESDQLKVALLGTMARPSTVLGFIVLQQYAQGLAPAGSTASVPPTQASLSDRINSLEGCCKEAGQTMASHDEQLLGLRTSTARQEKMLGDHEARITKLEKP